MAVSITPADVILFYPPADSIDESIICDYICVVDQADMCLDGAGVADCVQRVLKLNAVAYLLYSDNQVNQYKSMKSPTSESITNHDISTSFGLNSNPYGRKVKALDANGCLVDVLDNNQNTRFIWSTGGC